MVICQKCGGNAYGGDASAHDCLPTILYVLKQYVGNDYWNAAVKQHNNEEMRHESGKITPFDYSHSTTGLNNMLEEYKRKDGSDVSQFKERMNHFENLIKG